MTETFDPNKPSPLDPEWDQMGIEDVPVEPDDAQPEHNIPAEEEH